MKNNKIKLTILALCAVISLSFALANTTKEVQTAEAWGIPAH